MTRTEELLALAVPTGGREPVHCAGRARGANFVTQNAEVTGRPLADGPVDRRVRPQEVDDE